MAVRKTFPIPTITGKNPAGIKFLKKILFPDEYPKTISKKDKEILEAYKETIEKEKQSKEDIKFLSNVFFGKLSRGKIKEILTPLMHFNTPEEREILKEIIEEDSIDIFEAIKRLCIIYKTSSNINYDKLLKEKLEDKEMARTMKDRSKYE